MANKNYSYPSGVNDLSNYTYTDPFTSLPYPMLGPNSPFAIVMAADGFNVLVVSLPATDTAPDVDIYNDEDIRLTLHPEEYIGSSPVAH